MLSGKDVNDLINVDHSTIMDVHQCQTRHSLRGYVLLKVRRNEQQKTCNLFCNTAAKRVT